MALWRIFKKNLGDDDYLFLSAIDSGQSVFQNRFYFELWKFAASPGAGICEVEMTKDAVQLVWFEEISRFDVARVGGKNASLGEMICNLQGTGVKVPPGFATTAEGYWRFVEANGLTPIIQTALEAYKAGKLPLQEAGETIRRAFLRADWPADAAKAIREAYRELSRRSGAADTDVAVRSSATAEDLPDASFAGQQESFLNVRGE